MTETGDPIAAFGSEARSFLAALVQASDDAVIGLTPDGAIASWSPGARALYGYQSAEIVGRPGSVLAVAGAEGEWQLLFEEACLADAPRRREMLQLARDRRQLKLTLCLAPVRSGNRLVGICCIARDCSTREQLEKRLRESEKRYQIQIEQAADGIVVLQKGRFVYANCAALGIYGAESLAQLQALNVLDLVPQEERSNVRERFQRLQAGEEVPLHECRLLRLDGGAVPVETSSVLIDYQGTPSIQVIARDISERRRHESERERLLRELDFQRDRFETVLRQMPVGVMIAEAPTGRLIYSNQASSVIFRQEFPEVRSLADYHRWSLYRMDGTRLEPEQYPIARALLHGERVSGEELEIVRADGSRGFVSVNAVPLSDPGGRIVSSVAAFTDITGKVAAAEALRQSEERLQLALDATGMGMCDMDAVTGEGLWNRQHYTLLGYPAPEGSPGPATTEMWQSRICPEDLPMVLAALEEAKRARSLCRSEHRVTRADDGRSLWVDVLGRFSYDASGNAVRFIGVIFDVTDRKAAEEALRASEAKFRWVFESNLVAIFFWTKDGRITEANQAYCDLVGFTPNECRAGQLNWLACTPPEQFDRDFAAIEEIMTHGACRPYEKEFVNRESGRRVPVLLAGARMAGTRSEGMGFAIDLTDLKRAEQSLKESETTLKLAIEATGLGTFDWDLVSGRASCSDIAKAHFGLPPDAEVDAGTLLRGVHPEDRERVEQAGRQALTPQRGGHYDVKYRTLGIEDGKERWISTRGQTFFNPDGEPVRFVGASLDITEIVNAEKALKDEIAERLRTVEELHKKEQMLIRQGRLAALGEMIGNIAHQWRQPLNTLALIIQELPWFYDRGQFSREYLNANVIRAMQVINHMSKTIDGFRNFFEPNRERVSFRVAEVLAQTVSMVQAAFNELRLEIEVESDPELLVHGNPNEFSQVILNLLVNAKDALLERRIENPRVTVRLFGEGERVVLTVTDNAGGISPDIVDKIFDPYFTTKGPDKGTGIGLFMSKTIVEKNMSGTLSVHNTADGAEFRIEV